MTWRTWCTSGLFNEFSEPGSHPLWCQLSGRWSSRFWAFLSTILGVFSTILGQGRSHLNTYFRLSWGGSENVLKGPLLPGSGRRVPRRQLVGGKDVQTEHWTTVGRRELKPVETRVESAWNQRLKLKYDKPVSELALKLKLRRYSTAANSYGGQLAASFKPDRQEKSRVRAAPNTSSATSFASCTSTRHVILHVIHIVFWCSPRHHPRDPHSVLVLAMSYPRHPRPCNSPPTHPTHPAHPNLARTRTLNPLALIYRMLYA